MTIALGIIARDGLVVAADSEESSGYLKTDELKILTVMGSHSSGAGLITGAGTSDYIDALKYDIADLFLDHPELNDKALQRALGQFLKQFYEDHVIPFAVYPEDDRPDLRMLFGVHRGFHSHLFFTNRSVVGRAGPYKTIGMGSTFAKMLLDRLWRPNLDVKSAEVLAAYVIFMAKESVESCGKFTSISTLHGPTVQDTEQGSQLVPAVRPVTHVAWTEIDRLEEVFKREWSRAEQDLIWSLISKEIQPKP
jgi:hypothetical protein